MEQQLTAVLNIYCVFANMTVSAVPIIPKANFNTKQRNIFVLDQLRLSAFIYLTR